MKPSVYDFPKYYEIAFSFRNIVKDVDFLERIMNNYSGLKGKRILEIACGCCPYLKEWNNRGYQYTGLESNTTMIRYAKKIIKQGKYKANLVKKDLVDFNFDEDKYELVYVLLGSLYVNSNKELKNHLDCVAKCLKKGGLYAHLTDYSKIMENAVEGYPTTALKENGDLFLKRIIKTLCEEIHLMNNKKDFMTSENTERDQFERKNFVTPEKEPYICGNCGVQVMGGRYNNHCPKCLWSKHVDDKIPGDRASTCQQLMQPVGVIKGKKDTWRIVHQCTGCDHRFTVDSSSDDNFDAIIKIFQNPVSGPSEIKK